MELFLCHNPCKCKAYSRTINHSPSLGKFSQVRLSQNGLGAYRKATLATTSSSRWNLSVAIAAAGFNYRTIEGYDEHSNNLLDQPTKFRNLMYDKYTNGLEKAGQLWQGTDIAERAKELGDYLGQLKEFQEQMESKIEQGDNQTVSTLVKANNKALMEQMDQGNKSLEQVAMLDVLVQLSLNLQDAEAIRQMLEQMKDVLVSMDIGEPFVDAFLEHTGSMFLLFGNKEEALSCYKRSVDIQESLLGTNSPELVGTLLGLAGAYTEAEEREKGKAVYNRIVSILESSIGPACEELGTPLLHLGYMLLEDKQPEEAELCIRRALNIVEKDNAKGGRMGVTTCGLARVKYAKGDYEKAAELYENGLNLLKNSGYWSNGDLALEYVRMEVAEFYSVLGRTKEAQSLWEEVLHEKERLLGVNSPRLVVHLQNLATSYAQDGRFDRCEPLLRRSLKLVTTSLGPTAPQVSIPLEFLATTLHHLNQDKEAESLARQALSIREKNFPDDHLLIGEACNILASILHANKKNNEALKHARRALHIKENHLGKDSKELAWTLDLLLELLDVLGKPEEALPLLGRLEGLLSTSNKAAP